MRSASIRLPGHPDHACHIVAEAILDEYLRRDPASRVRVSVTGGRGVLFVSGDVLSEADFDVSSLVKRTLGTIGVTDDLEPFISLEPIASERVGLCRLATDIPVMVTGYATSETSYGIPETVLLARQIAKALDEKRQHDPEWFWMGPDAEVTVIADQVHPSHVALNIEHGKESFEKTKATLEQFIASIDKNLIVELHPISLSTHRGLVHQSGSSDVLPSAYGSLIPPTASFSGRDPSSAQKAGAWLTRAAALSLVRKGARAALVQAIYFPGEHEPRYLTVRDERGQDLSSALPRSMLSLHRVMKEWWRPNLNLDAARWGYAGEAGLPWEE